jgi:two-component system sensor histidine kinase BarA
LYDTHRLSGLALLHRLQSWGMEVELATSEEQLKGPWGPTRDPHLVVLGLTAKDCHGSTGKRLLGRLSRRLECPLLCLVSSSASDAREQARRSGADLCLSKPVSGKLFYDTILTLTGNAGLEGRKSQSAPQNLPRLAGKHVLVVDDNPINLSLVCRLLERTGARIATAENGQQAVQLASDFSFDLVFMDVHMPELSGLKAAEQIRDREVPGIHAPIVALTADVVPETRERIFHAGMDDCLLKPVLEEELWTVVRTRLRLGSAVDAAIAAGRRRSADSKPSLAVWDQELALTITGGDLALAQQMLEMLRDQLPKATEELELLGHRQNWSGLREAAHKLRGSTMYCGVPALDQAVGRLEQTARDQEPAHIDTALQHLKREAVRVCELNRDRPEEQGRDQPRREQTPA